MVFLSLDSGHPNFVISIYEKIVQMWSRLDAKWLRNRRLIYFSKNTDILCTIL